MEASPLRPILLGLYWVALVDYLPSRNKGDLAIEQWNHLGKGKGL